MNEYETQAFSIGFVMSHWKYSFERLCTYEPQPFNYATKNSPCTRMKQNKTKKN